MRYRELIDKMTLEEKASLMSGANFWNTKAIERLNIPSMMLTDGPHGLRKQGGQADHLGLNQSIPATCFPTASALANSWDTELAESVGEALGLEAAAEDVSVLLGPGLNIKRSPLCGRNFEYFSEDPFLSGKLAAAMIRGIQSQGVSACPKHFAVNSQEHVRMSVDEIVDERALRELYLEGFRYAVQEGKTKTIMTSYNRVNGDYANENEHLLKDILREEWGFEGLIVTDWGGENDRVAGLIAGNQLEMPSSGGITDRDIVEAVKSGRLAESVLDERVDSYLSVLFDIAPALGQGKRYTDEEHDELAHDAARRSAVLLKNKRGLLPLKAGQKIAVIGDFAKTPRYQGAGSSLINPRRLDCALDALMREELEVIGFRTGFKRMGGRDKLRKKSAVELAARADTVLLFMGLPESSEAEGLDRSHMRLPDNQIELLYALREVCPNIIVILAGGAPIEMPWEGSADAILHCYLAGQAGGAVVDILTGRFNPGGKLAESYPMRYEDVSSAPFYPGREATSEHRESIFIGYRYFDSADVPVMWPFGYGLSYTSFEYSELRLELPQVRFKVQNTGASPGEEIAQLYISKPESGVFRAKRELKGFSKVFLEPGEESELCITLDEHAFKYFDAGLGEWTQEAGRYEISVGASSRDLRLCQSIMLPGETDRSYYSETELPSYFSARVHEVSQSEFEALLGRPLPDSRWDRTKTLGYNDLIAQGQFKPGFGRFLYRSIALARSALFLVGKPVAANSVLFIMNLPFRHIARMSGGRVDMPMLDGIMTMVNGQFRKGLGQTLKARREKKKRESRNG